MFYRYRFESEIYPTLRLIPLHVRMKLDLTGTKISLKHWLAFGMEERAALCHLPAETEEEKATFVSYLDFLLRRYFGEKAVLIPAVKDPPWEDLNRIPDFVRVMSEKAGGGVTSQEWRRWNSYQRYALLKLTSSKNEPELFFQALKEFRSSRGERE